jgi:signal transduction histidine kinase/ligand-binding sensor domain-containing protein/DNA-binding response OmpR family regulator
MKSLALYIVYILIILSNGPFAFAQTEQFKFRHLTTNDGLSDNQVRAVFKDSRGFIWVGTGLGLNRFDGYTVKAYRNDSRDTTSLISNGIVEIFETPDHRIGVVTGSGLTLYHPRTDQFERNLTSFHKRYGTSSELKKIVRSGSGMFWFLESHKVIQHDPKKNKSVLFQNIPGDTTSISRDTISGYSVDKNGSCWIVHRNGVVENIEVVEGRGRVVNRLYQLHKRNRRERYDYQLFCDSDGDVWIWSTTESRGVYCYDHKTGLLGQFTTGSGKIRLTSNMVSSLAESEDGKIWVGTDQGGVNVIDKRKSRVRYILHRDEDNRTIAHNSITSLYRDDHGIIWAGTYKRGISYYHKSIFRFDVYKHYSLDPSSLPFEDVNRFAEDNKGNLWIGTNGGGLLYFNRQAGTFKQYVHDGANNNSISGNVIVSLCIDHEQNLWIGTYKDGLNKFDGRKFTRYQLVPDDSTSLPGNSVWEIFEDSRGRLWIGMLDGGVARLDIPSGKFERLKVGLQNAVQSTYISSITEDRHGNIWFGTLAGIDVMSADQKSFTHYQSSTSPGSLSNDNVLDLKKDSRGRMWVGTSDGINLFDEYKNNFRVYRYDEASNNPVLMIQEDARGGIWMSTVTGLFEMTEYDSSANVSFKRYTDLDGLQGLQFNENASIRTRKGELIFGGPAGFNIIDPENLQHERIASSVVFTDLQLYQKSVKIGEEVDGEVVLTRAISEGGKITLPPRKNFFSVEFSALNYVNPEKTRYSYKLEGPNAEWLPLEPRSHKLTFNSLNPGKYTLKVKATNDEGQWGNEAVLSFTILPPFWKTNTAMALYVLFGVVVLYVARRIIQQREKLKFAIEQEHREVIRVHELDMMKTRFFTNVSHEFRTPLTLILTPLEKLIRHANDPDLKHQHELIQRNAKRLLNLVNQLLDFRKLEVQEIRFNPSEGDIIAFIKDAVLSFSDLSEKKSIQLTFNSTVESLETIFDKDKLEKILFNLLSNAIKFTMEDGKVAVRVDFVSNGAEEIRIDVEDTGIGIPANKHDKIFERFFQNDAPQSMVNQGSGIGLSITKEFVKIHGGRIELVSEPGKGSKFTVYVPVKRITKEASQLSPIPEMDAVAHLNDTAETETPGDELLHDGANTENPNGKKCLLIVEDNDDFRFYLKDNLKISYNIIEARNGAEGWALILSKHPDLIVSDIMMPEMNGIDLCRKIKTDERVSHIPVLLLTARGAEEQRLKGFETGADEYITKPFNFEILESRIKNLIQQRERSQKIFRKTLDVKASELNITPLDTKFIQNAIKCVEENVASPEFSVEQFGRELGISRAYLYKKILALTGKSPLEFIRTIRLQHAAQLLEKSQLTVSEIAYRVGFNNPKYFTKYFKEEFHVLPSQYVASLKKNV